MLVELICYYTDDNASEQSSCATYYCRSYPFEQVWNEDKMETAFFRSDANGLWRVLGATDIGEWGMK